MNHAHAVWFEGNFKVRRGLPAVGGCGADTPHRVAYKKLVRS